MLDASQNRLELRRDQLDALDALKDQRAYAIVARMGAGKTAIALRDAERLYLAGRIRCLLVTAPPGVTVQWVREQAPRWLTCDYDAIDYRSPSDRTRKYVQRLTEVTQNESALQIVAIHFEALSISSGARFVEGILRSRPTMWVIDESTKIKNPKAARTKMIHRLAPLARYRRIMTGTPVTRGIECLWAQYKFVDPAILGTSFYAFRARYCDLEPVWGAPAGVVRIVGYRRLNEFMHRISGRTYYGGGSMPKKTYTQRVVAMTREQAAAYARVAGALNRYSDDDPELDIPNVLAQMTLLQRIVCGHVPDAAEENCTRVLDSDRAAAVADIVDETDGKIIVWHRFSYDAVLIARALRERLPEIEIVEYSGIVSPAERILAMDSIRSDSGARVMIAQLQAASHGLDIPQVSTSIYYSGTYDAEVRWQSEDRQRPGLMHPGVYVDLVTTGSIDEDIASNVAQKGSVAEFVRRSLQRHRASVR